MIEVHSLTSIRFRQLACAVVLLIISSDAANDSRIPLPPTPRLSTYELRAAARDSTLRDRLPRCRPPVLQFSTGEKVEVLRMDQKWHPATITEPHETKPGFYYVSFSNGWKMIVYRRTIRYPRVYKMKDSILPPAAVGIILQFAGFRDEYEKDPEFSDIVKTNQEGFATKCQYWSDNFMSSDRGCWKSPSPNKATKNLDQTQLTGVQMFWTQISPENTKKIKELRVLLENSEFVEYVDSSEGTEDDDRRQKLEAWLKSEEVLAALTAGAAPVGSTGVQGTAIGVRDYWYREIRRLRSDRELVLHEEREPMCDACWDRNQKWMDEVANPTYPWRGVPGMCLDCKNRKATNALAGDRECFFCASEGT